MADQATENTVPPDEEISDGGSPQESEESGKVAEPGPKPEEDERVKNLEKRVRDLQAAKDRAEAEVKKRDRADMDEVERLNAELQDAQKERDEFLELSQHWYLENFKNSLVAEFNLPPKFARFLHGMNEEQLRQNAQDLADLVGEIGVTAATQKAKEEEEQRKEEAPTVTGGSGQSPEIDKEYEELKENAKKSHNYTDMIKHILGKSK